MDWGCDGAHHGEQLARPLDCDINLIFEKGGRMFRTIVSAVALATVMMCSFSANAQSSYVEPYWFVWCSTESNGVCQSGAQQFYLYNGGIEYGSTTYGSGYQQDYYYIFEDSGTDIDLIYAQFSIDDDEYELDYCRVYQTGGTYYPGNDIVDSDESDGYVSFNEYRSSGLESGVYVPSNWDYGGIERIARCRFDPVEDEDTLYIYIYTTLF
jgi:hypothetical protein